MCPRARVPNSSMWRARSPPVTGRVSALSPQPAGSRYSPPERDHGEDASMKSFRVVARPSAQKKKSNKDSVVKLVANVEDLATGKAFNRYKYRKVGGTMTSCLIERSKVMETRALSQILLNANANLPIDQTERVKLMDELVRADPPRLEVLAPKVGWVEGKRAFVRHGGVSGKVDGPRALRPPAWVEGARHRCQVKGDSATWLTEIAPIVAASSRIQLACAAIYAAPLVRVVNMQPFAIVLYGPSSAGKSSAVLVAGSLLGLGTKEAIPSWNLSVAGLQETATHFNDHALLIDETGSADLPKDQLYDLFRRVTYTYAEGADRLRHSKSGFATSRETADAKGILLTTSEHSLDALAAFVDKVRDAGEIARAFNVPAVRPGETHIFDTMPDNMDAEERMAWTTETFSKIRSGCPQHHGGAFKRFMEHLVGMDRAVLIDRIDAAMNKFTTDLALNTKVGAVRHAARNFALVYAGGALAIDAELLPITKKRLLKSIVTCFRDGLAEVGPPADLEKVAIAQLHGGIAAANFPLKSEIDCDGDPAGFRSCQGKDDLRILLAVKPAVFDQWFASEAHRCAALRWLHAQGLLRLRDGAITLPSGPIPANVVVSFEKMRRDDGSRVNRRWIRFVDPSATK